MSDAKLRGGHRAMATRLLDTLEGLIQSTDTEENKIRATVTELKRHRDEILIYDKRIQTVLSEEEVIGDMEESSRRLLLIEEGLSLAENCLVRINNAEVYPSSPQGNLSDVFNRNKSVKLPTLNLPTFQGDPLEWHHFWDIFRNAVHSRPDISNAQKFVYLTGQLRGEAAALLDGFTTTDANYAEAVKLLEDTYGEPRRIIQSHLHFLFDLSGPKPDADSLSKYRSAYECHLRGLKALGTNVDGAGFVFAALLLRKLPARIRDNINRTAKSHYWELEEFRQAIASEIMLLQAAEPRVNQRFPPSTSKSKYNYNSKVMNKESKSGFTVSNFNVGTNEEKIKDTSKLKCRLCFSDHHLKDCKKYKTVAEKWNRTKELNLCEKCLINTHTTNKCYSKTRCRSCNGQHNNYLCSGSPSVDARADENITSATTTPPSHLRKPNLVSN